jgi:cytochrome c-type biogenesis protein CcmH
VNSSARQWVSWGLMAVVLVTALVIGVTGDPGPRTNQDRVYAIADTMKCPQCTGQSVADSDVAIAREIRLEIARAVDEGRSDDEIRDQIASGYGDEYLLTPRSSGVSGLVWIIPVVAAVAAFGALTFYFYRTRGQRSAHATDADRSLVDAALVEQARHSSTPESES